MKPKERSRNTTSPTKQTLMQIAIVRKTGKLLYNRSKMVLKIIDEPKGEKRLPSIEIELDLYRTQKKPSET